MPAHEVILGQRSNRAEYLDLLVTQRFVAFADRRFHREMREHLQQVVLDHVAQRADLLVETAASLDAEVLGHGYLHVVDVVAVPDRLQERVREAEEQ